MFQSLCNPPTAFTASEKKNYKDNLGRYKCLPFPWLFLDEGQQFLQPEHQTERSCLLQLLA